MVDEREDRYDDEEGEYHFSDDQLNYEEVETPKKPQSAAIVKKSVAEQLSALSPSRRMLIASVVFMSLIGMVYKMLSPNNAQLPTDIAQIEPAKPPMPQTAAAKPKPPITTPTAPVAPVTAPEARPTMATVPAEAVSAISPPPPQATGVVPVGMQNATQAAQAVVPAQTAYPPTQIPPSQTGSMSAQPIAPAQGTVPMPVPQTVADRVKAVEDHNAAMMNLLQTEYAQKLSEFEMQSSMVRGKMDEMSKRINRIETSLNQITQMLQQNGPPAANNKAQPMAADGAAMVPAARPSLPKNTYTVQAIIPGRAWLKADSGDTVTVAEGDTLRDYGRISKIDPYDGVVEIDTGSKIIALSYGMNAE